MGNRFTTHLLLSALICGTLIAFPAKAQIPEQPTAVPEAVNIEDPIGDANYINRQNVPNDSGDHVGPNNQDAASVTDLAKGWMTNDETNFSIHILTEAAPPAIAAVGFEFIAVPGEGSAGSSTTGCLRAVGIIPGGTAPTWQGDPWARLLDRCNIGTSIFDDSVEGTIEFSEIADVGGLITLTFPRSYSPLLADGAIVTGAYLISRTPTAGSPDQGFAAPFVDDTKVGTDYTITTPAPEKPKKPKKPKKPRRPRKP
jgi:hypothetical protein